MPKIACVMTTESEIDAALLRVKAEKSFDQLVLSAQYQERTDLVVLELKNGVTHSIPRRLLQGLTHATSADLSIIEVLGTGSGLYWPTLDVAHEVTGLLSGVYGSAHWMREMQIISQRISA